MGFKNGDWDLLKYKHGQILTATFEEDRAICAYVKKSKIDCRDSLTFLFKVWTFWTYTNDK